MRVSLEKFADQMNELLPQLLREFMKRQSNELFKGKITFPQFLILDFLFKQEEAAMSDIAHYLMITTAAATGTVDRLVKCGFVRRMADPSDRRVIKIRLTPAGTEVVRKIHGERRQMICDVFGQISEQERDDYLRILTRIHEVVMKDKAGMLL